MDPVTMVLVPGLIGGALFALAFFLLNRRDAHADAVIMPDRSLPISTDIINAASVKVAGIGGLGLVAMAATVALNIPRIFETMRLGLVLGTAGALFLIIRRR